MLLDGIYPEKFEIFKIIPIPKKDSTKAIENYRPIALLPTITKTIKKAIRNRLLQCLEHKFFFQNQHGFRQTKSTLIAIVRSLKEVIEGKDTVNTLGIFLDFQKAFHCVN